MTRFGDRAVARGLYLRMRTPRRRPAVVQGDPTLLRQIAFNFVQNALRYTSHGGVLVGVRARASAWRLEVRDTGIGVAAVDRARIFSPFYRSPSTEHSSDHPPSPRGLGLGLAVVARCADLMGATFGFESTSGRGSLFWVQLPVAESDAARRPPGTAVPLGALSGHWLLVDDDPHDLFNFNLIENDTSLSIMVR